MYLEDMQISIGRILQYVNGMSFDQFKKDTKTVDAVIRNFEILGEAAKNVPDKTKEQHPDVPWDEMYYMRNKVSQNTSV